MQRQYELGTHKPNVISECAFPTLVVSCIEFSALAHYCDIRCIYGGSYSESPLAGPNAALGTGRRLHCVTYELL